jgi:mutator protein MutT
MARVVASVVERDGRILLCQRRHDKRHGGLWEFPGGKVEAGESDYDAVARELAEELGVTTLAVGPVEFSRPDPGSHFIIEFVPVRIEGEPICHEHAALAWVEEARLLERPLAPADWEFAVHRLARLRDRGSR